MGFVLDQAKVEVRGHHFGGGIEGALLDAGCVGVGSGLLSCVQVNQAYAWFYDALFNLVILSSNG